MRNPGSASARCVIKEKKGGQQDGMKAAFLRIRRLIRGFSAGLPFPGALVIPGFSRREIVFTLVH